MKGRALERSDEPRGKQTGDGNPAGRSIGGTSGNRRSLIRRGTSGRLRRRRSLLKGKSGDHPEQERSVWNVLLTSYTIAIVLYVIWTTLSVGLTGRDASTTILLQGILSIPLFIGPIVLIGHYGSRYAMRRIATRDPFLRQMSRTGIWLAAGVLGSIVGYEILQLVAHGALGVNASGLAITLSANLLIVLLVSLAGAALTTRRRGLQLVRQQQMLTEEFSAANRTQQSLLPKQNPNILGFDISGAMQPAVEVGGDYYDYLTFADGTKGILVADAAGKGMAAALVMAKFQGMAQALSIHVTDPSIFFVGLNDTLRIRLERQSFITVGMVTIDLEDRCAFWRAGHNGLLHYQASTGQVIEHRPPGLALGLAEGGALGSSLSPIPFNLAQEDILLLFSDGLVEALDERGEEFGEERLSELICQTAGKGLTADGIRQEIFDHLAHFVGNAEEHDDVTIVVIRRMGYNQSIV